MDAKFFALSLTEHICITTTFSRSCEDGTLSADSEEEVEKWTISFVFKENLRNFLNVKGLNSPFTKVLIR